LIIKEALGPQNPATGEQLAFEAYQRPGDNRRLITKNCYKSISINI
jgi:hypothetical protein